MEFLSFLKVGLLAMLERLDLVPKELSDRAAIEHVQKYGIPQPAPDDGFDDEQFYDKRSDRGFMGPLGENIADVDNPELNILGTPLRPWGSLR